MLGMNKKLPLFLAFRKQAQGFANKPNYLHFVAESRKQEEGCHWPSCRWWNAESHIASLLLVDKCFTSFPAEIPDTEGEEPPGGAV